MLQQFQWHACFNYLYKNGFVIINQSEAAINMCMTLNYHKNVLQDLTWNNWSILA